VLNPVDVPIGLVGSVDLPCRAIYGSASGPADQTIKNMRQSNLPEEAPSGIQAARHFPL